MCEHHIVLKYEHFHPTCKLMIKIVNNLDHPTRIILIK